MRTNDGEEELQELLFYHLVPRVLPFNSLRGGSFETLEGNSIRLRLSGQTITVNNAATVIDADILANNGVIHVIDEVLSLPQKLPLIEIIAQTFVMTEMEAYTGFSASTTMITEDEARYTVFTPWDLAFDNLPADLITKLRSRNWNAHLRNLILYHFIDDEIAPEDLSGAFRRFRTMNGERVQLSRSGDRVNVNGNNMLGAVEAENGKKRIVYVTFVNVSK